MTDSAQHQAENDYTRATVAEAIAAWEAKGPTSLTVALMAEALYGVREIADQIIDGIEETFLAQLPSKAISYCAQEDVNAGLDALRERFLGRDDR